MVGPAHKVRLIQRQARLFEGGAAATVARSFIEFVARVSIALPYRWQEVGHESDGRILVEGDRTRILFLSLPTLTAGLVPAR